MSATVVLWALIFITVLCISFYTAPVYEPYEGPLRTLPTTIPAKETPPVKGIPRNVYMSWNTYNVPRSMYDNVLQNAELNPDFSFHIYDDARCRDYIERNYGPEVVGAFDALKPGAYKSDLWRLCIIYKEGGVYMDMKFSTVVKLHTFTEQNVSMFVQDLLPQNVYQGFFIANANEPVLKKGIDKIVENVKNRFYGSLQLDPTGPGMLGPIIKRENPSAIRLKLEVAPSDLHNIRQLSDNTILVKQYPSYRTDQMKNGAVHYTILWNNRDIYN